MKPKQQWSIEETNFSSCTVVLEIQNKLEGASTTKPVFEQIQHEQVNNNVKNWRRSKGIKRKTLVEIGSGRPRQNPHFHLLDWVLGDRLACQVTEALKSATAWLEAMADDSLLKSSTDPCKFYFSSFSPCCQPAMYFLGVSGATMAVWYGVVLSHQCSFYNITVMFDVRNIDVRN